MQDAATRVSYPEAQDWLGVWGLGVSKSQLQRLSKRLERRQQELTGQQLRAMGAMALAGREDTGGKRWCIEMDGCLVATKATSGIEWPEVKSALLYPMRSPTQRHYLSCLGSVEEFAPLVHGLLRQARVRQSDRLIGISDRAVWIAELMGDLGVHRHILDVYHASTYLETLLLGLGWPEEQRLEQRKSLVNGEISLQRWLNRHLHNPSLDEAGRKALAFLEKQAQLDHTDYPRFKHEGLEVIGSGQIEGANKHIIGQRLKITGAHWSVSGADAKALARSQFFTLTPVTSFDLLRLQAFPPAA
jgi:hypothetical protein